MDQDALEPRVRAALQQSKKGPLKAKELGQILQIPAQDYRKFRNYLRRLEQQGAVYRIKGQRYALPEKINLQVGTLSVTRNGDGFVIPESGGGTSSFQLPNWTRRWMRIRW